MKTYGGAEVQLQLTLTSALNGGHWAAACRCLFTPKEGKVKKVKVRPCTGTEALYRPYGP